MGVGGLFFSLTTALIWLPHREKCHGLFRRRFEESGWSEQQQGRKSCPDLAVKPEVSTSSKVEVVILTGVLR